MNVQPRYYQADARQAILAAWGETPWWNGETEVFRKVVLNIPTSSGKTIVAGLVCEAVSQRGRFLYLADRDELCTQPQERFRQLLGITTALDKAEERADQDAQVVVGSLQTMWRDDRLQRFRPEHFKYIFVDEAHRHVEQAKKIIDYFSEAKVCGQTATAFRAQLKDLSEYYDTVAYRLGLFDLIKEGFIVPLKVRTLPVEIDISNVRQSQVMGEQDYNREELSDTIKPYYHKIAELIKEHAPNRQIVAFLPLIVSSQRFVEICLNDHNIKAEHIDHKSANRRELLREFEQKKFQLISCSTLLSTGWDCPPCDTLLNLSPTRSAVMWHQKVGRIGRVLPGVIDGLKHATERQEAIAKSAKPDALILDLLYHADKFGLQGPADLIASTASERAAVAEMLEEADEEQDLIHVVASVQEEREAVLKHELEEAARRKAEGLIDAQYYGALMHDREVTNYEPTMKWHFLPVTEKQKEYLLSKGIDVDTVRDRGHASALTSAIWGRKQLNLCPYRVVLALEKRNLPGAWHYSEEQAYRVLLEDFPFPFGAPSRRRETFGQVSPGYWRWLADQARTDDWVEKKFPIVLKHLKEKGLIKPPLQITLASDVIEDTLHDDSPF